MNNPRDEEASDPLDRHSQEWVCFACEMFVDKKRHPNECPKCHRSFKANDLMVLGGEPSDRLAFPDFHTWTEPKPGPE